MINAPSPQLNTNSIPIKGVSKRVETDKNKVELSNANFTQNVSGRNIVVINNYYNAEQQQGPTNTNPQSNVNNNQRCDRKGNPIMRKGNHHLTFIDKVTNSHFVNRTDIESFKIYNLVKEEAATQNHASCCVII